MSLCDNGKNGSGARVLDRLRVLLHTELCEYQELAWRVLIPIYDEPPPSLPAAWLDIDALTRSSSKKQNIVKLLRNDVPLETLKRDFAHWFKKILYGVVTFNQNNQNVKS